MTDYTAANILELHDDYWNADPKHPKCEKKPKQPLKRTPIKRKPKQATGQREVFEQIWNERPHRSEISQLTIGDFYADNFLHVLAKGRNQYPLYKLYKPNIIIGTRKEHELLDAGTEDKRKEYEIYILYHFGYKVDWQRVYDLRDFLKSIYPAKPDEEEFNLMFENWKNATKPDIIRTDKIMFSYNKNLTK